MKNEFLDFASEMYYEGKPVISDIEFDSLSQRLGYSTVGHSVTNGIKHFLPMYSLRKVYKKSDMPVLDGYVESPKLDGAAVSLLYVEGRLALALTRGDGKTGRDITDKMKHLVPNQLSDFTTGTVQITGEVIAPSSIENSRNYAAGALNLKDMDVFLSRDLTFVAYDVQGNLKRDTWSNMQISLYEQDFNTVDVFDCSGYPTDGIVFRLDSYEDFNNLGYTSSHPRGAFALKEVKEGVETTLLDVVWQVGKSGVVSPVAILEPIDIGGATVSKATLHNIEYIRELSLELGCQVEVIRSGEIIPRIVRRIY